MLNTAQMFDKWTQEPPRAARKGGYDPGRAIYLSEAGGCERKSTLRLLRFPQDQPTDAQRASWARGLLWESYLTLLWAAWYPKRTARQANVRTPYGNGKIDLFVNYDAPDSLRACAAEPTAVEYIMGCQQRGEYPHILEIKTKEAKAKPFLPDPAHVNQTLMYMHFYECIEINGVQYKGPRPTGELAYGIIDTNEVLSFPVEYDAERANELEAWLQRVQQATWARTPLPIPGDYAPDHYPCGGESWRCNFARHCWE